MLTPARGSITVPGAVPAAGPAQLARVGFVAQDTPVYARMTAAGQLRLGAWLNPGWARRWPGGGSGSSPWTPSSVSAETP
jgi:ABC-2 type transport system ATP-binding protein